MRRFRRYAQPGVNNTKRRIGNAAWKLHKRSTVTYRPNEETMHHLEVDREWEEDGAVVAVTLKVKKHPISC